MKFTVLVYSRQISATVGLWRMSVA